MIAGAGGDSVDARLEVIGARAFDGAGQLFKLRGQRLQFGGERLGVEFGKVGRGIEQGVEHHCDARQDGFLDAVERVVEACLLFCNSGHGSGHGANGVKGT